MKLDFNQDRVMPDRSLGDKGLPYRSSQGLKNGRSSGVINFVTIGGGQGLSGSEEGFGSGTLTNSC